MKAAVVQSGVRARSWLISCCSCALLETRRQIGCIRAENNYAILGATRKEV